MVYSNNIDFLLILRNDSVTIKCHTGGSALNTCGTLRAIGEENLLFYGSIGADENGILLQKKLQQNGVKNQYVIP